MQIHAYAREYLDDAQSLLGEAFDFATVTIGYSLREFAMFFVNSDASRQIEKGNVKYVAGMNGCELTRLILEESGIENNTQDAIYLDRSPEYWCGYVLAFYQWFSNRKFFEILKNVNIEEIFSMYDTFHEMDIMQFADAMDQKISAREKDTHLKQYRSNMGYTQSELAAISGVSIRQIQLFEQRVRDINKAASITLLKLSKSLYCSIEDLMEVQTRSAAETENRG